MSETKKEGVELVKDEKAFEEAFNEWLKRAFDPELHAAVEEAKYATKH